MKVSPNKKTIVTLDCNFMPNLWNNVVRMKSNTVNEIQCSGLDQILVDTETYGSTTLSQILNGKHMKRGFEAHMILYLSLSNQFLQRSPKSLPLDTVKSC